mgnify:CR=1 FL=1
MDELVNDSRVKKEAISNSHRVTPPLPIPGHIYRKRLIQELTTKNNKVTFIYGPPGAGKTVLASQLHGADPKNTAWFTVHSLDSSLEIVNYIVAATRAIIPNYAKWFEDLSTDEIATFKTVLNLCKEIGASKRNIKFIMDESDLFNLENLDIAQAFMKCRPENVSLFFIRRKTPSQSTYQFLNGIPLRIITPVELNFQVDEIMDLRGIQNESEAKTLIELTDGWPAGIAILSDEINLDKLRIGNSKVPTKKLYFAAVQQSLGIFDDVDIEFINKLIWFDQFSPDMAKTITGNSDADRTLFRFATDSNFISRIQNDPPVYRLNQMVQESLIGNKSHSELNDSLIDAITKLMKAGFTLEALRILSELGDDRKVSDTLNDPTIIAIITAEMRNALHGGKLDVLNRWNRISKLSMKENPIARRFLDTYITYVKSDFSGMKVRLQELESMVKEFGIEEKMSSDISVFNSYLNFSNGNLEKTFSEMIGKSSKGFAKTDFGDGKRISFLRILTWSAFLQDNSAKLKEIEKVVEKSESIILDARDRMVFDTIRLLLAIHAGRNSEASDLIEIIETKENEISFGGVFALYETKYAKANILIESNRCIESARILKEASLQAMAAKQIPWVVMFNGKLAELLALENEVKEAFLLLSETRALVDSAKMNAEMHLVLDRFELAIRFKLDDKERIEQLLTRMPESFQTLEVRTGLLLKQKSAKISRVLEKFDKSIPKESISYSMNMGILNLDRPPIAKEHFWRALELGSTNGYFDYFLKFPSEVSQVLISIAGERSTVFLERLARELGVRMNSQIMSAGGASNLTKREADILRHLSTGLPIKVIAGNLNISKNTIKTHLRNLYKKLEVADRREAVEKGRELLKV